jgi:membrane-associated protease RseP (regulator of RpoE activity)
VGGSVTAQEVATSSRAGEGWIGLQVHLESEDRGAGRAATSLVVKNVLAESPAEAAGLRSGDRVLRINGREVGSSTLARLGSRLRPGDAVALTVERDGWQRVVRLRAGHRPDRAGAPPVPTELAHRLDSAVLRLDSVRVVLSGTGADAVSTVLARIEGMPSGVSVRRLAFTPDGDSLTAAGPVLRVDSILRIVGTAGDLDGTGWTGDDRTSFQVFVKQRADSAARQLQEMAPRTPQPPGSRSRVAVGFGTVPDPPEVRVPPGAVEPARAPSPPDDEGRPLSVYVAGANRVAGAEVTPLNPGLAAYFGANRGLLVTEVIPGTPAEEGGLRPGDVVVSVDGRPVDDLTDLRETLTRALRVRIERDAAGQTRPPGEAEGAAVEVVRKGRTLTLRLPH